jgi:nicotinamidase/pyrazinamidase
MGNSQSGSESTKSPKSSWKGRRPTSKTSVKKAGTNAEKTVALLIIDPQNDFHEGGSLAVNGATADSQRTAALIRAHRNHFTSIYITLDSHHRNHVAHGISWVDKNGKHPAPFTIISGEDARSEVWKAADPDRVDIFKKYAADLEKGGKFKVCIWPEHCLIGTKGHAVHDHINEAIHEWSGTTRRNIEYVWKGENLNTESYSAMAAEVPDESDPRTKFNVDLMAQLNAHDILIICGQALSHCVNFTARDIEKHWVGNKDRIILLKDCASAVGAFEQSAEEFKGFCEKIGIRVMDSQTLTENWDQICGNELKAANTPVSPDQILVEDTPDATVVTKT